LVSCTPVIFYLQFFENSIKRSQVSSSFIQFLENTPCSTFSQETSGDVTWTYVSTFFLDFGRKICTLLQRRRPRKTWPPRNRARAKRGGRWICWWSRMMRKPLRIGMWGGGWVSWVGFSWASLIDYSSWLG
jgi:hypothetical protein